MSTEIHWNDSRCKMTMFKRLHVKPVGDLFGLFCGDERIDIYFTLDEAQYARDYAVYVAWKVRTGKH